jgi:hypothetical protein
MINLLLIAVAIFAAVQVMRGAIQWRENALPGVAWWRVN